MPRKFWETVLQILDELGIFEDFWRNGGWILNKYKIYENYRQNFKNGLKNFEKNKKILRKFQENWNEILGKI